MKFKIKFVEQPDEKTSITQKIMHSLPKWFSPPEDIERKAITHRAYPFFAAFDGDKPVGFVALKIHNEYTTDIYNLGILEDYHRQGIGRCLLEAAEGYCIEHSYQYLTVKTLDASAQYEPYEKTRNFYHNMGFIPLEVFLTFWDEDNPCLFMAKFLGERASVRVFFPVDVPESLQFVVIAAQQEGKWLFVRHKERDTYEIPGGHIEQGETPLDAARRELYEESGAVKYTLNPVCYYGVNRDGIKTYGFLYFAQVEHFEELPDYEMRERVFLDEMPKHMTYPQIQPLLMNKVRWWLTGEAEEKQNG